MLKLLLCRAQTFQGQASGLGCDRLTSCNDRMSGVVLGRLIMIVVRLRELWVYSARSEVNSLGG